MLNSWGECNCRDLSACIRRIARGDVETDNAHVFLRLVNLRMPQVRSRATVASLMLLTISGAIVRAEDNPCAVTHESIELKSGTYTFPRSGKIVIESHLATNADLFARNALFPGSVDELMGAHLERSCKALQESLPLTDCREIYRFKWSRVWTPAEGGHFGQGSVGDRKPSVGEELWVANMNWAAGARPAPGTRFLATNGSHSVVVVMGYESGPSDASLLAGLQSEAAWALKVHNSDIVQFGRMIDQHTGLGPIDCSSH